jgi:hypothetical protein
MKANHENFREIRKNLRNVVNHLRHPLTGMFKDNPGTNLFAGRACFGTLTYIRKQINI